MRRGSSWASGVRAASGDGQFEFPIGIALDSSGKFAYVTDKGNHRIQKFDVSSSPVRFITKWGSECNLTATPPTGTVP
jgi:DNA-binding beta-propeller fold protein YncE